MSGPESAKIANITRKKRTVDDIANAILQALQSQQMREKAANLGQRIRSENGIAEAVVIIEKTMLSSRKSNK